MIASFFGIVFVIVALTHVFKSDIFIRKPYRDHPNRKQYQKHQAMGNALLGLGFFLVGRTFPDSSGELKLYIAMVVAAIPGFIVLWRCRKMISKAAREEAERFIFTPVDPVVSARNAKKRNHKK